MQQIENAVMPKQWFEALPREQYAQFEKIDVDSDWFYVYKLPNDVYAIYEPCHFQEVISFLIIGSEKAILQDTGMGMFDIKKVVQKLTDKPLYVINSHSHFDHIGGNYQFDTVHVLDNPHALRRLKNGVDIKEVADNFEMNAFNYPSPLPFDLKTFTIKPSNNVQTVKDGDIIDIGNRKFKVISTPGHSPDSIMLVNDEEKILFTGDTIYPASLYAHITKVDGLDSVIDTYRQTVTDLAEKYSGYTLYCSHNEPIRDGSFLQAVKQAFDAIAKGEKEYETDSEGLKKYQFDGFAVITQ